MKHYILLSLSALLLLCTMPVKAQYYPDGRPIPPRKRAAYYANRNRQNYRTRPNYNSYNNNMYYGMRLGLGIANVNSDSKILDTNESKTGLNVGMVIGTQLTNRAPLFFETGLYYTEKGGKSTYNGQKFTYGLNYVELPLLLKYKYHVDRDFSIEPFVGGYLACGVGGKIKDYDNRAAYPGFSEDYNDNFNRFDGGIKVGCGLGFQMLYLEASYDVGLANVGKDDFEDTHTGTFNLTFGVNF